MRLRIMRTYPLLAAVLLAPTLAFGQNFEPFDASQTWDVPAGVTEVYVHAIGGGGGGGRDQGEGAGGAGGGAYCGGSFTVPEGSTLDIVIGPGGPGRTGSAGTGDSGGTTTVTVMGGALLVSAAGGAGGQTDSGGVGGAAGGVRQ